MLVSVPKAALLLINYNFKGQGTWWGKIWPKMFFSESTMVKNYVVGKTFYLIVACSIWIWIDGGYSTT